ncbi:bifunctional protein-serine/threonine kinase/phosphatase [Rheinheimera sp. 4Y26]|uniref:bifunctional protein-serine/threonine kinase/phosphatase n=1 Tax=Rheinheimera sp. 4Y26 TaxID=2977811 RepID=UPI0021B09281|nr:bifunctional protein-serine/threonine kinase/phosphatase [Rheinheimera sp. 4Y26]MCT6701201.1 protein phosphatase 2C domain-containing protein [Rheinheimera sp. 4Y26]
MASEQPGDETSLLQSQSVSQLRLAVGGYSCAGHKSQNEDAIAWQLPKDSHLLTYKGGCFCLADGVSSAEAGAQASDYAVQHFASEYANTPDSWSVNHSASQLLASINTALYQQSHAYVSEEKGFLCTFSGLIIKSHTAYFFHIGDSRIYLWRKGVIAQLTQDHTTKLSENRQFLGRALGMDEQVQWQSGNVTLEVGDRFLLCSDGLSDFMDDTELSALLSPEPQQDLTTLAEQLCQLALKNGSDDNISALIVEVQALSAQTLEDYNEKLTRLPFLPVLVPGMKVDGYQVEKEIFASSRSHLYLVRDLTTDNIWVLKTPSVNFADDHSYIERFIREEWIGLRISHPNVVQVHRQQRPRTFLYYLLAYVEGETLEHWFARVDKPLKPAKAITLVQQIAAGLQAFHKLGAVHQDLKPGNIMRRPDGTLVLVDFGSVYVAGLAEMFSPLEQDIALGTASYSDPHYLLGHNSGVQGDVYALATICYELFTGQLPYGPKVEDCQTMRDYQKLRYQHSYQHNPVIPPWFDRALELGVSLDLSQRYSSVSLLMKDLQNPNPLFLQQQVVAKHKTNRLLFWQLMSGFWFATLLLVIWLFLIRRG